MQQISHELLPQHIAIIMDGNGRWATRKGRPRMIGHRKGADTVRSIVTTCAKMGISQLTLYAFSYENWQRSATEVNYLMKLLRDFLIKERKTIMDNNIQFSAIGRLQMLPEKVSKELYITKNMSQENTGMRLSLALSYSGRNEIVDATKLIAQKVAQSEISIDEIDENLFSSYLYQPNMPDPDLLIRTGGDMRISNFLLWQISYAEIWVTDVPWPEFSEEHLNQAIAVFTSRERRFGQVLADKRPKII